MSLVLRGHRLFISILIITLILGSVLLYHPIIAIANQIRAGYLIGQTIDSQLLMSPCELSSGDYEERNEKLLYAIQLLDQAIVYEPNYLHSYLQLGKALCLVGRYTDAENVLNKASQLHPHNYLAEIERGFVLEKICPPNGECESGDTSIELWKSVGITASQFIANGENAYNHQDYKQAISWYTRAQEMGTDLQSTIAYLGFELCGDAYSDCARSALSYTIQVDHGWVNQEIHFLTWYYYGRLLFNDHEWESAQLILQQAETLYPNGSTLYWELSDIHRLLGLVLANQHMYAEALIQLEEAINLYPKSYWAHIHFGATLYQSDKNNVLFTQNEFDTGLELAGSNDVAWDYVINYWIQYDQPILATQYCDKAIQNGVDMAELKYCSGK